MSVTLGPLPGYVLMESIFSGSQQMVPQEQGNSFSVPTQLPNESGLHQEHFFLRLSYFLSLLFVVTMHALKSVG